MAMSCGVGCRHGSDLAWLWLWLWPTAVAPIQPLVWEPPYAMRAALQRKKKKKSGRVNGPEEYEIAGSIKVPLEVHGQGFKSDQSAGCGVFFNLIHQLSCKYTECWIS